MQKSNKFLKSIFSRKKTMCSSITYQNIFKKIKFEGHSQAEYLNNLRKGSSKAQSAMEYLMTYGWSILIIAIALVVLFELGIFNGSSLSGTGSCIAQPQFLCTKPILASNGILVATIGEALGQVTLTGIACNNNAAQPLSFNSITPITINTGETLQMAFYCPIPNNAIGTSFNGNLWIQYNTPAESGQIIEIGSVSLKITVPGESGSSSSSSTPVYVPITLTNQQSSATTSGFQQMITFNPSTYSSNEVANLSNIELTADAPIGTSGNVPLYSWIESGASATASNTVIWVNLGSLILGSTQNYISVNVINSQNTGTGTDFQQMIYFNPSSYSSYEASDLGNIRFYNGNNELYSWCESGCTSTSSNAIFWINTGSLNIGPNSYATVNMIFEPTSTEYDGVYAGEAPQLSQTYGEYDNGANVFTNYWNFAGTNLPSGWTGSGYTINNGISIPYSSYANNQGSYINPNDILEMYGDIPIGTTTDNACAGYIGSSSAIAGGAPAVCFDINTGVISNGDVFGITSPGSGYSYTTAITTTTNIYGITWQSSSSTYFYVNYGKISQITTEIPTTSLPIGFSNTQGSQTTIGPFYWARTRITPPNGVMPTFQLSGVNTETSGQNTATIYLNFLPNNSPVTSGYTGYAPQLYCASGCFQSSYAQYDDGTNVFNFYDNFAGTTLNTNKWTVSSGSPIVNNELELYGSVIISKQTFSDTSNVLDIYGYFQSPYAGYRDWSFVSGSNSIQIGDLSYYYLINHNPSQYYNPLPSIPANTLEIFTLGATSSYSYTSINYGSLTTLSSGYPILNNPNIQLAQTPSTLSYPIFIQWIRTRSYPPNGVIPSVSFGSIT